MIEKIKSKYIIMDEYGYTDAEMVNKVNEIIDAVNKISAEKCRWIPVEERLPKDGEKILIARKFREGYITEYDTCVIDGGYCLKSCLHWKEVIAWMPLPEYKEGDVE